MINHTNSNKLKKIQFKNKPIELRSKIRRPDSWLGRE